MGSARRGEASAVLFVCLFLLTAGFLLKGQCLKPWEAGRQFSHLCYNDIQPLFFIRGVAEGQFPYVEGDYENGDVTGGSLEYPVLTGLFLWATGLLADDANQYLKVSALALAPFALLAAYLLARMTKARAFMFAAAPALILYAFHNWDLPVVAATVGGFYLWWRGHPVWAAVSFGIGAALKIHPIFFLAPLVLERAHAAGTREAAKALAAGVGTFAVVNLPFVIVNFPGWWATYQFHRLRGANYDSIWFLAFPTWTVDRLNAVTALMTAIFFIAALIVGVRRARAEGRYPFVPVAAAMLVTFLLWNKVHSPQYTLWLLPFFALMSVHWGWWAAYSVVDLAVYVGVFRWFYDLGLGLGDLTWAKALMTAGIWARAALLLTLFVLFLRGRAAPGVEIATDAERFPSHPAAKVERVGEQVAAPT